MKSTTAKIGDLDWFRMAQWRYFS